MTNKFVWLIGFLAAVLASNAMPTLVLDSRGIGWSPNQRMVRINYSIQDGPAVVTMQLFRNGDELLDESLYANASGDVNRLVSKTSGRITWTCPADLDIGDFKKFTVKLRAWAPDTPPPYMVVHLANTPVSVSYYATTSAFPGGFDSAYYKTMGLTMRRIPAAGKVWRMSTLSGASYQFKSRSSGEAHDVQLTKDYYLGVYEYTYGNHNALTGVPDEKSNWCHASLATLDADNRTYPKGAVSYVAIRGSDVATGWPTRGHDLPDGAENTILGLLRANTGITFDLPTEAEWEFACRGDGTIPYYNSQDDGRGSDDGISGVLTYAWTAQNSSNATVQAVVPHPVGSKLPNSFGLYDMLGNQTEWTLDGALNSGYASEGSPAVDPKGSTSPDMSGDVPYRVMKGGGYGFFPNAAFAGFRARLVQTYTAQSGDLGGSTIDTQAFETGFRVCCPAMAIK